MDVQNKTTEGKMKGIINRLLRYYLQLYEISKSDF